MEHTTKHNSRLESGNAVDSHGISYLVQGTQRGNGFIPNAPSATNKVTGQYMKNTTELDHRRRLRAAAQQGGLARFNSDGVRRLLDEVLILEQFHSNLRMAAKILVARLRIVDPCMSYDRELAALEKVL